MIGIDLISLLKTKAPLDTAEEVRLRTALPYSPVSCGQ